MQVKQTKFSILAELKVRKLLVYNMLCVFL